MDWTIHDWVALFAHSRIVFVYFGVFIFFSSFKNGRDKWNMSGIFLRNISLGRTWIGKFGRTWIGEFFELTYGLTPSPNIFHYNKSGRKRNEI